MDGITLCVLLGAAAGGFVQGLSGFAFGLVAIAFWAWFLPPQLIGPMIVFGSMIGQIMSVGAVRRGFDRGRVLPFIVGGVVGVPLGVAVLRYIDGDMFKAGVGALLAVYGPALLLAGDVPPITAGGRLADGGVGFVGGVMGGIGGLTGPAPTLWCTLRGWGNDAQRAVFQSFNLVMQALTLAIYAATGLLNAETGRLFVLIVPAMLIPTLIGARFYRHFSEAAFRRLVLGLLTLSGVVLLATALPKTFG